MMDKQLDAVEMAARYQRIVDVTKNWANGTITASDGMWTIETIILNTSVPTPKSNFAAKKAFEEGDGEPTLRTAHHAGPSGMFVWSAKERAAIDELMKLQQLTEPQIIRQALRHYQIECLKAHGLYTPLPSKLPPESAGDGDRVVISKRRLADLEAIERCWMKGPNGDW